MNTSIVRNIFNEIKASSYEKKNVVVFTLEQLSIGMESIEGRGREVTRLTINL